MNLTRAMIDELAFQLAEATEEGETQAMHRLASVANVMRRNATAKDRNEISHALADFGFSVCLLDIEGEHDGRACA